MRSFIAKNTTCKIVAGGHITENGTPIKGPLESVGVSYCFDDGTTLVMSKEDAQSAPDFTPAWQLD